MAITVLYHQLLRKMKKEHPTRKTELARGERSTLIKKEFHERKSYKAQLRAARTMDSRAQFDGHDNMYQYVPHVFC